MTTGTDNSQQHTNHTSAFSSTGTIANAAHVTHRENKPHGLKGSLCNYQDKARDLSRRGFLSGVGVLGAALASTGLSSLAGCSPASAQAASKESWLPEKWDYEADLVAVGGGGGGLAAAIQGQDEGLEVIVIEMLGVTGGSSAICGGGIGMCGTPLQEKLGIDDSPEKYLKDVLENSAGPMANEANIKAHIDTVTEMYDWLTGLGLVFPEEGLLRSQGNNTIREHHVEGGPGHAMQIIRDAAEAKGAQILLNTEGTALIQDPATKQILGVVAKQKSKTIYLKARRGVLLATGSFAANLEMLEQYRYGLGNSKVICSPGNMGGGHKMAMQVGAVLLKAGFNVGVSVGSAKGESGADIGGLFVQGAILVNREGKRFIDESVGINSVGPTLSAQTGGSAFQLYDQKFADIFWENPSNTYCIRKHVEKGLAIKCETLEDAAREIGCPVDALKETLEKYNADVTQTGSDSVFGRKFCNAGGGELMAFNQAPYYVFETVQAMAGMGAGLWENEQFQVLDQYGVPIPNLYTAGEIVQYTMLGVDTTYWVNKTHCGWGWCGAMNHARQIAKRLLSVESWDA
ncbi:MAG: FAD-binding protein [Coriobacteriaceae bacterium]|jgi:flavocytochrome c|nr:FAD-binding protein [Coriobacteriaceae bacterium]